MTITTLRLARISALVAGLARWQLAALRGLPEYVLSPLQIIRLFGEALSDGRALRAHLGEPGALAARASSSARCSAPRSASPRASARWFDRLLSPAVFLTYPVPKIVMLPIFMLWFGIGDLSKVLIIALACFYPVFINAYYGVRATPQHPGLVGAQHGREPLARSSAAWCCRARAPMIFAGMRVSLALSFIVMFAAEMINARSGLGHLIRVAENCLRFDLMYVSLLAIAILGYAGDRLVRSHSRLLAWQQPA